MAGPNGMVGVTMGLFITVGALFELLIRGPDNPALWVMPFGGVLFVLVSLGMGRLGRWLSSGDEDWILAAIRSAFRKSTQTNDARSGRL
jgi:hypothetical protein